LPRNKLADGSGNVGSGENRGRDLIEQWLKDVVIAAIDQNNIGVGSM
jgi:hypothetical protein